MTEAPTGAAPGAKIHLENQLGRGTPGGFWRRFVASFLDAIVVMIATIPLRLIVDFVPKLMGFKVTGGMVAVQMLIGFVIWMVAVTAYYGYFYQTRGATPAKALMGLKVLNYEDGTYLSWQEACLRETIGKLLSSLTLMIGYLMAAFRADKRALHDLIAGSQVVMQKNES